MKWVQKIDDCGIFVKQIEVQFLKEYHSLGQILHVSMTAPWKTPEAWATHTKCEFTWSIHCPPCLCQGMYGPYIAVSQTKQQIIPADSHSILKYTNI